MSYIWPLWKMCVFIMLVFSFFTISVDKWIFQKEFQKVPYDFQWYLRSYLISWKINGSNNVGIITISFIISKFLLQPLFVQGRGHYWPPLLFFFKTVKNCSKFVFFQNLIIFFLVCPFMTAMTEDKTRGGVIYHE